jgi:hypothetical protein
MSDCEAPVLQLLRECVHLNAAAAPPSPDMSEGSAASTAAEARCGGGAPIDDEEPLGGAESVEESDLAGLLGASGTGGTARSGSSTDGSSSDAAGSWAADNMSVVYMDWRESIELLEAAARRPGGGGGGGGSRRSSCDRALEGGLGNSAGAPTAPLRTRYGSIIASEVMYEPAHAVLVAGVIAHRLAPGGRALVSGRRTPRGVPGMPGVPGVPACRAGQVGGRLGC